MSAPAEKTETVAARVRDVIQRLPPKDGRKSRIGHISIEDFADLLGTTKQRVIDWRKGAAYPGPENREKLARVSGGRYTADHFKRPSALTPDQQRVRLQELGDEVAALGSALLDLSDVAAHLAAQVVKLGGEVPSEMLDVLRRVTDGRRP